MVADSEGHAIIRWASFYSPLKGRSGRIYSQFGEDGLIAALFEDIGITNRWCFEVGAANGTKYSNVRLLIEEEWFTVLIEGQERNAQALNRLASDKVQICIRRLGAADMDDVLSQADAPVDLDFGVIDIDGQDYWLWDGMVKYVPRVMLVEYAPHRLMDDMYIPPLNDEFKFLDDTKAQAGFGPIRELGEAKGYSLVATTHCNLLFCRSELVRC